MAQPIQAEFGLILGKGLFVQKFFLGFSNQNELARSRITKVDNDFVRFHLVGSKYGCTAKLSFMG
jgi:hypothetical protein